MGATEERVAEFATGHPTDDIPLMDVLTQNAKPLLEPRKQKAPGGITRPALAFLYLVTGVFSLPAAHGFPDGLYHESL